MKQSISYIPRTIEPELIKTFQRYPIITVIGARQTGKSTLVQHVFKEKPYVNLEDLSEREFAASDPKAFLSRYESGAILDEIQNTPELLSYLQVLVDEKKQNGLFVLTGSHQLSLHAAIAQSLAGRTAIFELLPLSIEELENVGLTFSIDEYIYSGFFPRIHKEQLNPTQAYRDYMRTYIERDVRKIINVKDLTQFQLFLKLCAARVGQILNLNNLCNEVGISNHTAKAWLSILEASYLIIRLQPYFENFGKRNIKSPKIYFTDVGLVAYLLDINNVVQIQRDPLRGQLVENLVITELFKYRLHRNQSLSYYFYRDHNLNEVDVIFKDGNDLIPIEIKSAQTFNSSFLKGLKYFAQLAPNKVSKGFLIYCGNEERSIEKFSVINYKNVKQIFT